MEEKLRQIRFLLRNIYIYNSVLKDEVFRSYIDLLDALAENKGPETLLLKYSEFIGLLARQGETDRGWIIGDPWSNHIMELVLGDDNIFTRKGEYVPFGNMSTGLRELAAHDLKVFQQVSGLDTRELGAIVAERLKKHKVDAYIPELTGSSFYSLCEENTGAGAKESRDKVLLTSCSESESTAEVKQTLFSSTDWSECLEVLAEYAKVNGCGIFRKYWAFRWIHGRGLLGISHPDPVRLSDLISYERQREEVVDNTRRFVHGLPANNVLLYGDRGTGKSSTVKALIHEFGQQGLRLVEVGRQAFIDFQEILEVLRSRSQRFIIFIDDLSFEEYETEYKNLKAVMEGGVQPQPQNVLIYATSNRKHLVRETLKDRISPGFDRDGEIHPGDTLEEKISLADRFGIVVTFMRPDRKTYLQIVEGLAAKKGISLSREELHSLALKWEMLHNGRSGRTARQFILDLLGRASLEEG